MNFDIIVVGSCNIDLTNYVTRPPLPGETIQANSFITSFGGKGANQAVMAKLLGANVGNDTFADSYKSHFSKIGLSSELIETCPDISTGTATIIVDEKGQNSIILNKGANQFVDVDYIKRILPPLLFSAKILMVQMEIDPNATFKALKMAKNSNAPALSCLTCEFYKYTDILCCNEIEMEQLSNIDCKSTLNLEKGAKYFFKNGCKYVIVTLGEKGAAFFSNSELNGIRFNVPKIKEKIVDTTGSGDAFLGALSYYVLKELHQNDDLEICIIKAISKAIYVASLTVTAKGAQKSYEEIISRINSS